MNISVQILCGALFMFQFVGCTLAETGTNTLNFSRPVRQTINTCVLPLHPDNGRWSLLNGNGKPGDQVDPSTILKYECHPEYKLSYNNIYVICDKGWSANPLPVCEKLCLPLYSTSTTTLECFNKLGEKIECNKATDDSYLRYKCIPYYEVIGSRKNIYCAKGVWNLPPPVCQPICGRKVGDDTIPLVFHGTPLKTIKYPWIVAIYEKDDKEWTNICGGNIISTRFVLTAAHCVTNEYGEPLPAENYQIASAKLYNKYRDAKDKEAQYLEVLHIIPHPEYNGESKRFLGDIAIIITKIQFRLGSLVQPVCISGVNEIYLRPGDVGEVAGWGRKEDGLPSDELRFIEIPYKHPTVCKQELPTQWEQKYNLIDKMCAGHYKQNISVCKGDSGSGLVFRNSEDNRFYIHGVVSLAPAHDGSCDIQQNALYTKVAFYHGFIDLQLTKNSGECRLPNYPHNGKWVIENDAKKVPGDLVSSDALLRIQCNEGYALTSENATIDCESARFRLPICQRTCPPLTSTKNTAFKCTDRKRNPIDCTRATEGSILSYECAPFYEHKIGTGKTILCGLKCTDRKKNPIDCTNVTKDSIVSYECFPFYDQEKSIVCVDGAWNISNVDCQPVCGKLVNDTQLLNKDDRKLKYPWIIAIYEYSGSVNKSTENEKYEFVCVGTLISRNVIITAAHCITNSNGESLVGQKNYKVAAAKYYRRYKDPRDKVAEYLDVSQSFAPPTYRGSSQNFLGNIAILVTKGYFTLGPLIQPICFKNVGEIDLSDGDFGIVAGWSSKISSSLSDELVDLEIPYKSQETCLDELPTEFTDTYYFKDKLCAGHYKKQKFVCRGDGGSGLAFKNPDDGRFYLHGIVSLAPLIQEDCDPNQNALYTHVRYYSDSYISVIFSNYEESCRLPSYPKNGKWIVKDNPDKSPGDLVAPIDILEIQCSRNYYFTSRFFEVRCKDSHKISQCEKVCSPPLSSPTAKLRCVNRYGDNIDCLKATEGSHLYYECDEFYEPEDGQNEKAIVCSNGSWNITTITCQPICGKEKQLSNDQNNGTSRFPWVVAIYKEVPSSYEFVCGGTLISRNLVLTAAFCLTDSRGYILEEKYLIGAAKYFRYKEEEEENAQYLEVDNVIVYYDYKGRIQNYYGNLALLKTKGLFNLNVHVQPACIKHLKKIEEEELKTPNFSPGVVSGWGTKMDDLLADNLIDLEIPYKSQSECLDELPREFYHRYYYIDKLCAGLDNRDKGVCNGDAGSGLVYKHANSSRYYIHGIVSLTPVSDNTCDIKQNTLYTKVSFAYEFIASEMKTFYEEDCKLPAPPENGEWMLVEGESRRKGDIVSVNDVFTVNCSDGLALDSLMDVTTCITSFFKISDCHVTCPVLNFPPGSTVSCNNSEGQEIDCSQAVDGVTLTFSCPLGYSALPGTSTKSCTDGTWTSSPSTCIKNNFDN